MKSLHRTKALESYRGARITLKEGLVYPSYMLLKEATRSTLAYINEDLYDKEYSEKTKMRTLLSETPTVLVQSVDMMQGAPARGTTPADTEASRDPSTRRGTFT